MQDTDQVVEALSELCAKMSVMFEHMNDTGTSVSSSQSGIASLSGKTPGEAADIDDHARTRSFELTIDPGKGEAMTSAADLRQLHASTGSFALATDPGKGEESCTEDDAMIEPPPGFDQCARHGERSRKFRFCVPEGCACTGPAVTIQRRISG